jgi:hypothetical protein
MCTGGLPAQKMLKVTIIMSFTEAVLLKSELRKQQRNFSSFNVDYVSTTTS